MVTTWVQRLVLAVFLIIAKGFHLPPTRGANGDSSKVSSAARVIGLHIKRIKSVDNSDFEHSQIATSLHELGSVLQYKGDLDGAESQYRATLCMDRRIHGEDADHPHIATSLHQLGCVLQIRETWMGRRRSTERVSA